MSISIPSASPSMRSVGVSKAKPMPAATGAITMLARSPSTARGSSSPDPTQMLIGAHADLRFARKAHKRNLFRQLRKITDRA